MLLFAGAGLSLVMARQSMSRRVEQRAEAVFESEQEQTPAKEPLLYSRFPNLLGERTRAAARNLPVRGLDPVRTDTPPTGYKDMEPGVFTAGGRRGQIERARARSRADNDWDGSAGLDSISNSRWYKPLELRYGRLANPANIEK